EEPTEFEVPLESLKKPVNRLLGIKTVKGAFICSKDGLLIENYYKDRTDIDEICAMIAAIHNEAEESFKFLKEGYVEKFIIEKEEETICVIATGASLLTVITQSEVKPGLVFVYARKIIDEIREILG
ncbi:roadblock/LC7 domain-containing protein, partial [candidate division WOR-3 bacterium]|nr:roadblock/LC7 domain-containing protein [candidate division WOR-3 bacterium]